MRTQHVWADCMFKFVVLPLTIPNRWTHVMLTILRMCCVLTVCDTSHVPCSHNMRHFACAVFSQYATLRMCCVLTVWWTQLCGRHD
jgi:hypothetical protein